MKDNNTEIEKITVAELCKRLYNHKMPIGVAERLIKELFDSLLTNKIKEIRAEYETFDITQSIRCPKHDIQPLYDGSCCVCFHTECKHKNKNWTISSGTCPWCGEKIKPN